MSKVTPIVEETKELTPLFEPFKWHREEVDEAKLPGRAEMHFAGTVIDVTSGVQTILEMRHFDELRKTSETKRRLLSDARYENLARLCIASLGMLNDCATNHTDWAYKHHTPEGRTEYGNPDLGL